MDKYNEDPKTLDLYPKVLFEEDLTPDIYEGAEEKCNVIHEACKGFGTNEDALVQALGMTSGEERFHISLKFKDMYDKELKDLMKAECGKGDFGLALQYLALSPVASECAMIKKACSGVGTNEKLLYSIICGRSNEDMELLKKTYYKLHSDDLTSKIMGEVGGALKKVLLGSLQAAEENFDEGFHTDEKAEEDVKEIYDVGQGRLGTDESKLVKVIVMSPPKYLKKVNSMYADKYGYTLFKVIDKELGGDAKGALLHTLGIKLKPFETIAKLIKAACAGIGTDELLLTCTLLRYQEYLPAVAFAHEELFEKSIQHRIRKECRGDYENLLLAIVNQVSPEA